jgi:hypothetical protein
LELAAVKQMKINSKWAKGPLENPQHEYFAQRMAAGAAADMAYLAAGYQTVNVKQAAWRLKNRPEVIKRIEELKQEFAEKLKETSIAVVKERVNELDDRWKRMKALIRARAADPLMQACAGGETGLMVRKLKILGNGVGTIEQFEVDTGLLSSMLELEEQAAKELGQWTQKLEVTGTFNLVEKLNAGRQRVAEAKAKEKVQPISEGVK